MRRRAAMSLICLALPWSIALAASPTREPSRVRQSTAQGFSAPPSGPPHAWLFGTWTGGLFPVLDGMAAQDCRTQPTVAFAQDIVGHASLLTSGISRRVIETVRTSPNGAEFRFAPEPADAGAFGCDDANTLHVVRASNDRITFPNCAAFPYPLQRCPTPTPTPTPAR